MVYLGKAIEAGRKATERCPNSHADLAGLFDQVGIWLGTKFKLTKDFDAGDEAIRMSEKALEMMPITNSRRPDALNNLAFSLEFHYQVLCAPGAVDALDALSGLQRAIKAQEEVIERTAKDQPALAERMNNLVAMLVVKHNATRTKTRPYLKRQRSFS